MHQVTHSGVTPLTPAPLMEIADGFRIAKTLAVALEMELFSELSGTSGTTPREFADTARIPLRPAEMLLVACASLGLLEKREDRYSNSPMAEEFLVRGKRYFFGDLVRFTDRREYDAWGRLEQALRENRPTAWNPDEAATVFEGGGAAGELFWNALFSGATFTAKALAMSVDFTPCRRLLDVGGGAGASCIELASRYPALTTALYELPPVCELAKQAIAQAGLLDRVTAVPGDFWQQELPEGYDAMLLSNVLHDWSDEQSLVLLRKCHAALDSGGFLVIAESFLDDNRTGPVASAVASLNMLVETVDGKSRSRSEYESMLAEAGFSGTGRVDFLIDAPLANGALVARKR